MEKPEHPLLEILQQQSIFSQSLLQDHCDTDRYRKSFLPTAIMIHNKFLSN